MASKLYINGDSHSAGAELVKDYCFAEDDPDYFDGGRMPHPGCLLKSYGWKLAEMLDVQLECYAESASSNVRIIRTTKEYLEKDKNVFVLIGWSTWERQELIIDNAMTGRTYYQVSASGIDSVPDIHQHTYKDWIANLTAEVLLEYEFEQHKTIYDFHKYLQEHNIKHLFFNTYSHFGNIPEEEQYDWDGCYFQPYSKDHTFYYYLKNKGYTPNNNYHHGKEAHREWAKLLFDKLYETML